MGDPFNVEFELEDEPGPAGDEDLDLEFMGPRFDFGRVALGLVLLASLGGAFFAGLSTSDFVQHLDRQVHSIHCSLLPGAAADLGESGCRTVMMSPYSSFFRDRMWGGFPVSLWALAVFAFLAYRSGYLFWRGQAKRHETFFLVAATLLPVLMSLIYGYLSVTEVGATCKVCIGIYCSSALCFLAAAVAHASAQAVYQPHAVSSFVLSFGEGVCFVAALTVAYMAWVPIGDLDKARSGCGRLVKPQDSAKAMLHFGAVPGATPAIDLLDPLCPACRAFEERLHTSGLLRRLDRSTVLFPLDSQCNWMVQSSLHPGACAVSEAMLCAGGVAKAGGDPAEARRILDWAFKHQEELLAEAKESDKALRKRLTREFPSVKGCLGRPMVRNKLTKGLRWVVANALPVMTPQLFVNGASLCAEDTDLGLEYTLTTMLAEQGKSSAGAQR